MNALPEPCMCGAEDCPRCFPPIDDEESRRMRDEHEAERDRLRELDERSEIRGFRQRGKSSLVFNVVWVVIVTVLYLVYANAECKSRWEHAGVAVSWGPIQGCLVHLPDGRRIPDDRVREIDLPRSPTKKEER